MFKTEVEPRAAGHWFHCKVERGPGEEVALFGGTSNQASADNISVILVTLQLYERRTE